MRSCRGGSSHRSTLTPSDVLLPSFFVSDMYVVHFILISSTLLMSSGIAGIYLGTYGFPDTFVVVDESLEKRTLLFFSTSFSRVWISISEKLGLRFLVPDAMTRSKYCRYRYVD